MSRWRRGRDSNPRYSFGPYTGLANQRLEPLGHLSTTVPAAGHPARAPDRGMRMGEGLLDRGCTRVKAKLGGDGDGRREAAVHRALVGEEAVHALGGGARL